MIINRLTLHNFGIYASTNTFVFKNKKPIVLIGGMNGRGKTTFLEAVLLALYGTNSFAYAENKRQTYGQYLRSYINKSDGTLTSYVEMEFSMNSDDDDNTYVIKREWNAIGQRVHEKIHVLKNGENSLFLTDNWAMFIENILPSGLSNFFFFDGEKIAELAVEETNSQMKESIKSLLGISVLDLLQSDLNRIIVKKSKDVSEKYDAVKLESLSKSKMQKEDELQALDEEIASLCNNITAKKHNIEKAEADYLAKGGDVATNRHDLFQERNLLKLRLEKSGQSLVDTAAGELPLLMVKPLLNKIMNTAIQEQDQKAMKIAVNKLDEFFKLFADHTASDTDDIQQFISFVKTKSTVDQFEQGIYQLSEHAIMQCKSLCDTQLTNACKKVIQMQEDKQRFASKIEEIDSYLSIEIDENALTQIYKKIRTLQQELANVEVQLALKQKAKSELNGEYIRLSSEFNKFVESSLASLECSDDHQRIMQYAHRATTVLNEYKIQLQKNKIGKLSQTMTICYKKLANKKDLIESIEIDEVTLDFKYLGKDGAEVPKDSLSAGEKQLMVISMLWALAICSKRKLPVIIDTPLSRLDSVHRIALIQKYFPNASDQTIILSTDSEVDKNYYEIMKENVGDEFTLIYDEDKKITSIERGYFKGVLK